MMLLATVATVSATRTIVVASDDGRYSGLSEIGMIIDALDEQSGEDNIGK